MRNCIIRYIDTAVIGMQRQIMARIQFPVMGNNDVLVVLFIPCLYQYIAFCSMGAAVYGNHAVRYIQIHVFLCQNRIGRRYFTDFNIALFRADRHASIVRSYGSLNRRISFACGYAYIVTRLDISGSVSLADRSGTVSQCQRHIALPCNNIIVYSNIAVQYVSQHTVFRHNTGIVCHISLIGQRHHTAARFHLFLIIDIACSRRGNDIPCGIYSPAVLDHPVPGNRSDNIIACLDAPGKNHTAGSRRSTDVSRVRSYLSGYHDNRIIYCQVYIMACMNLMPAGQKIEIKEYSPVPAGLCVHIVPCVDITHKTDIAGPACSHNIVLCSYAVIHFNIPRLSCSQNIVSGMYVAVHPELATAGLYVYIAGSHHRA